MLNTWESGFMNDEMKEYGFADGFRALVVSLIAIVLFITIIGIPVALILMQLERLIQCNTVPKFKGVKK